MQVGKITVTLASERSDPQEQISPELHQKENKLESRENTTLRAAIERVAQKYDGSALRKPGRPLTSTEISKFVVRMAEENRGWGYTRIQEALADLSHTIGRKTVADILKRHGLEEIQ